MNCKLPNLLALGSTYVFPDVQTKGETVKDLIVKTS